MDQQFCSLCKAEAKLICTCLNNLFCEQCIGVHLLQEFTAKHRPMRTIDYIESVKSKTVETIMKPDLKSAISSKLNNEVLELVEFKKISLQQISEMVQLAEKELLETVEIMLNTVSDECDNAERDLKTAIALLKLSEPPSNSILSMFEACNSVLEVRDLCVLYKDLDLVYPNMKETIRKSINFSIQITNTPKIAEKLESPKRGRSHSNSITRSITSVEKDDFSIDLNQSTLSILSKEKTVKEKGLKFSERIKRSLTPKRPIQLENIEMEAKIKAEIKESAIPNTAHSSGSYSKTNSLIFPYISYFYPNSNRFTIYNILEANIKTIELPKKLFLEHSN